MAGGRLGAQRGIGMGDRPFVRRDDRQATGERRPNVADGRLTVTVLGQSSGLYRPGAPERALSLALTPSAPVAVGGSTMMGVPG